MKVTVKQKPKKKEKVKFENIEIGQVFKYQSGIIALKLADDESVLLKHFSGDNWFKIAAGFYLNYKKEPIKKILGTLTEIIVEE